jgi:Holliday junction resolvasome RuvABC endonuclease subunit
MKEVIRILSFDPGATKMGWSLCTYNVKTGKFIVHKTGTIIGDVLLNKYKEYEVIYDKAYLRLIAIREEISKMAYLRPDYVTCEDFFYQHGLHTAYASLALCVHMIKDAIKSSLSLPVILIPARRVKWVLSGSGSSTKDGISEAIKNSADISIMTIQDELKNKEDIITGTTKTSILDDMSEHECDAIAIAYTFAKDIFISLDKTMLYTNNKNKEISSE